MRLGAYLERSRETAEAFARRVGVSPAAISRYLRQHRIPEPEVMVKIVEATDGQVRPDDFYGLPSEAGDR